MKRKILAYTLAITMFGSLPAFPLVSAQTNQAGVNPVLESAPIDPNTIPEERLADTLKQRGVIPPNASAEQVKQALQQYIASKSPNNPAIQGVQEKAEPSGLEKQVKEFLKEQKRKAKQDQGAQKQFERIGDGKLDKAIWSHRWTLGRPFPIPNTQSQVGYWGGKVAAFDYTIEPEDGAVGVFAHEFGHDLGLPDEYDTNYTGNGEPVGVWSIMSGGSWAGKIAGTQPTSFSPQNKEFFQKTIGGNWANIQEVNADQLDNHGTGYIVDQSVTKSDRPGIVKVNLPDKPVQGIQPAFGKQYYYSNKGDDLHTAMTSPVFDMTNATAATFGYKAYYEIESGCDCDYLYVKASTDGGSTWTTVKTYGGNDFPHTTNGKWVDESIDLGRFTGKKVQLRFEYVTDGGYAPDGFALDNATLTVDGQVKFFDDAETTPQFTLDGFRVSNGIDYKKHYYYLEWRNYAGADQGLKYARGAQYNTGLLVWYGDDSYLDNWVGLHPGKGFLGVVDSHAHDVLYFDLNGTKTTANSTRYQIADAAFSYDRTPAWSYVHKSWGAISSPGFEGVRKFDDSQSYLDSRIPDAGRLVPNYGLKFEVVGEAKDNSAGAVWLHK